MQKFGFLWQICSIEWQLAWRYLRASADQKSFFHTNVRLAILFMSTMITVIIVVFSVFYGFQNSIYENLWNAAAHVRIEHQFSKTFIPPPQMITKILEAGAGGLPKAKGRTDPLFTAVYAELSVPVLLTAFSKYEIRNLVGLPLEQIQGQERRTGLASEIFLDGKSEQSPLLPLTYYQESIINDADRMNKGRYVLIGSEMAKSYGYSLGDQIDLFLPKRVQFESLEDVLLQSLTIIGFFKTGYYEFDQHYMYMSLPALQELLSLTNQVTSIVVRTQKRKQLVRAERLVNQTIAVSDSWITDPVAAQVENQDPKKTAAKNVPASENLQPLQIRLPSYTVSTIEDERKNLFQALNLERTMLLVILSLLVGAGIIGIWISIALLVKAKEYSLGVLRAMGMADFSIIRIFCLSSLAMGFFSLVLGTIFGMFLTHRLEGLLYVFEKAVNSVCPFFYRQCLPISLLPSNIYYVDRLPVAIDIPTLFILGVGTLTLSILAGFFPARRLIRQSPVEVLTSD